MTGGRIRQILTTNHLQENAPHQRDVREVWSHRPMLGLPCHPNRNWVPCKTTVSAAAKGLNKNSRRSLEELPGSLATERIKRARHEERAGDMRAVDPEQRPDRAVIEGTGASSSRDGTGNEQEASGRPVAMSEPQPRPAEPSVGDDQPPKEQSDDADMADPDSDRRRPRESLGEERETKESQDQRL